MCTYSPKPNILRQIVFGKSVWEISKKLHMQVNSLRRWMVQATVHKVQKESIK